jgi:hypothetical protein
MYFVGVKKESLIGRRFGKLVVLEEAPRYISPKGESRVSWVCQCECGNKAVYRSTTLKYSPIVGCGCGKMSGNGSRRHGLTGTKIYRAWNAMKNRCNNSKGFRYVLYGGRGIKVCERWNAFENFLKDMGQPPTITHTLDRIDVNGNYEPGNCRWVTQKVQTRNQRRNVLIEYKGRIQCVGAWCEELRIKLPTVFNRIYSGITDPSKLLCKPTSKR